MSLGARTSGAAALMTAEELYWLPDDGMRHELVDGEVRTMPPAGFEHGHVESNACLELSRFVRAGDLGWVVVGDTGFVLARSPDVVLGPDVAFVAKDRLPKPEERHRFAELAPDLVVEVVSPWDRPGEVTEKALRWVAAGVRLVWVVHPDQRSVAVYETGGTVRLLRGRDELDGGAVLPGFRLPLADLFA